MSTTCQEMLFGQFFVKTPLRLENVCGSLNGFNCGRASPVVRDWVCLEESSGTIRGAVRFHEPMRPSAFEEGMHFEVDLQRSDNTWDYLWSMLSTDIHLKNLRYACGDGRLQPMVPCGVSESDQQFRRKIVETGSVTLAEMAFPGSALRAGAGAWVLADTVRARAAEGVPPVKLEINVLLGESHMTSAEYISGPMWHEHSRPNSFDLYDGEEVVVVEVPPWRSGVNRVAAESLTSVLILLVKRGSRGARIPRSREGMPKVLVRIRQLFICAETRLSLQAVLVGPLRGLLNRVKVLDRLGVECDPHD